MKIECISLSYPNNSPILLEWRNKVLNHLGIVETMDIMFRPHDEWLHDKLNESTADVVVSFDSDCIPLNREIFDKCINFAVENNSIAGPAQAASHIPEWFHVYAAPSMLAINMKAWREIGSPSPRHNSNNDTGQFITRTLQRLNRPILMLNPIHYVKNPPPQPPYWTEAWKLGDTGLKYGIGTTYEGGVYHLFEGRKSENLDLWVEKCKEVLETQPKYNV